jgi:aspartate kinase
MIVQKYGGSSLETTEKIIQVAKKIIERKKTTRNIIVAVSAMGKTTDRLIELAKEISPEPIERELDVLLSIGEQQTISLLSMALNNLGHKAVSLTGAQAGINTKGNYTRASIEDIEKSIIKKYLEEGNIVVVAGFQGVNEKGDITTLGRGGSDTTAVALAAKFNCPCEIYTDVDGIYSIDPRLYEESCKISKINYDIALEMARLGAKVVDKRALVLGKRYEVPIYVGDSFKDQLGTRIGGESMEDLKILSLMVDDNQVEVRIKNIPNKIDKLSNVFRILGRYNLDIGMTENNLIDEDINISFICSKEHMKLFPSIKKDIVNNVDRLINLEINNTTRISIVGTGRINQAKVTSEIFDIVKEFGMKYKKFCTSELSLSYYFEKVEVKNLIHRLAKNFNL